MAKIRISAYTDKLSVKPGETLSVMASADAHAQMKPAAFGPRGKQVTGRHGALRTEGDTLVSDLLEDETS